MNKQGPDDIIWWLTYRAPRADHSYTYSVTAFRMNGERETYRFETTQERAAFCEDELRPRLAAAGAQLAMF